MDDAKNKLWLLFGLGVLYGIALFFFFQQIPITVYNPDFHTRWYTSRQLFELGRSIYDWQNAVEVSNLSGWPLVYELQYYYPAYMLIFTGPLSFLSYPVARVVWTLLGLCALWSGTLLFLYFPRRVLSIQQITIFFVLLTTSIPVFQHMWNGQFNTIGVLSLGLTYWALFRKRYVWAGVFASGLLFKPQATVFALAFFIFWSIWQKARWKFFLGLGSASLVLWGIAELLEPNWVFTFLESLGAYTTVQSVFMQLGDTRAYLSLGLGLVTFGLFWLGRDQEPSDLGFRTGLLWAITLSVLVIPMYGMLHAVLLGPMLALLCGIVADWKPAWLLPIWWLTLAIFIAGLVVFILVLVFTGTSGVHITAAEAIYRVAAPLIVAGLAFALFFKNTASLPG